MGNYRVKICYPVPMLHIAYSCVKNINSSLRNMHRWAFPLVELVMLDKYISVPLSLGCDVEVLSLSISFAQIRVLSYTFLRCIKKVLRNFQI